MKKINSIILAGIFCLMIGTFMFVPEKVHAGSDQSPVLGTQCSRHGFNQYKNCGTQYYWDFDRGNYYAVAISGVIEGHRHGNSMINASFCGKIDGASPQCVAFYGTGSSLGEEYGGGHPFNNYRADGRTIWGSGNAYVYWSAEVEDAEVRISFTAAADYVDEPDPVYGCTDPSATNYNPSANRDDGSCRYPQPPGPFSIGSGGCYGWPNPKIENNLNSSSGATSYSLHRRNVNGGGWQTVADRWWIGDIDRYGDPVSQYGEYQYYATAHNSDGNRNSDNAPYYYAGPSQCGQVLYDLSVGINSGSGGVYAPGISCPGTCSQNFEPQWITVQAVESTGYAFSSWNGACAGQGSSCSLYMDSNKSTSANFSTNTYLLSVGVSGNGSVYSSPGGISCGSQCFNSYSYGTNVELIPNAGSGSTFSHWSGACSGSGSCSVNMSAARSVTAHFSVVTYPLSVSISGNGVVNGSGINCPGTCNGAYSYAQGVALYATPNSSHYMFSGWSGDCSGTGSCNLTMTSGKSVTANFASVPFNYSLSNSGTSNVTKTSGNAFTQNTITKTQLSAVTQNVSLSLSGVPSGVTYSISNSTCSPTCSSTITFTVGPTTPVGTHPITVTGSPLSKTTSFSLVVAGSPITVACFGSPATVTLGQTINWTSTVSGGRAPFTYAWSGTAIPTSPAPSASSYSRSYSTIGQKTAQLRVTDVDGTQSTCPAATVQVNFNPNFEEF